MPYKDINKKREYQKQWREKNREEIRIYERLYQRGYYKKNSEKIRARKTRERQNREVLYQARARRYHRWKIAALKMYGGENPKCKWCGMDKYECLQIDHIKDDGFIDRKIAKKEIGGGENFYRWLLSKPYQPDRYQVLCANCNVIKRLRGHISYQKGLKTIKEWEEWAKKIEVQTPKELKKLWLKKKRERELLKNS